MSERKFFCLEHVRAYNKAWNFYANMTPEQMEQQRRHDAVWQRPTWPFSRSQENTRQGQDAPQNPAEYRRMPVNAAERHAVTVLGLETPYSKESLKACYRKQAKTAHPDLNPGKANAEERFKELREAYMTLLRPITK